VGATGDHCRGRDAFLCEAHFVEGVSDGEIEALFHAARGEDFDALGEELRRLAALIGSDAQAGEDRTQAEAETARLRRRFDEVSSIDFFGAPQREPLGARLVALEAQLRGAASDAATQVASDPEFRGRTWVTRRSIGIDRIASAWLIRRFIDREAEFSFVVGSAHRPAPGELRFDMFDAEFTHEGDHCTFEVLLQRFGLRDPALEALGEIVHDIDLKDGKFGRPETAGIDHLVAGIGLAHKDDEARLERGAAVFTDLYAYFQRKAERDRSQPGGAV
jgi:hypothetical protein